MEKIEDDYNKPLSEVYKSLPESTQLYLRSDVQKIWFYFVFWIIFIGVSSIVIVWLVECSFTLESLGKRLQRAGSIIPVLAVIGEALFIVRLNKLSSVIHPAQLTVEIYKQRRFKPLVYISLWVTFTMVFIGAVLSGYGDVLF